MLLGAPLTSDILEDRGWVREQKSALLGSIYRRPSFYLHKIMTDIVVYKPTLLAQLSGTRL